MKTTRTLLSCAAVAVFYFAACSGNSLHDVAAAPSSELVLMEDICQGITGDNYAKDIAQRSLALAYARRGYPTKAMELLKKTEGHQGLVGMATLAIEYSHKGRNKDSLVFLEEAERESNRFSISRPRQLSIKMAQAYTAVGNDIKADVWKQKLDDKTDLEEVQALIEAEKLRSGRINPSKISPRTEPELLEAIVCIGSSPKSNAKDSADWMNEAEKRVDSMYPVDRVAAFLTLYNGFEKMNRAEDSKRVMSKAESICLQISTRINSGTLGRILIAESYSNKGDLENANKWVALARNSISENSYMGQPLSCSKLAEVLWKMGNQQEAQVLWTDALNRARTHVHPRARRLGTLVVLESLSETNVELSTDQLRMVESVKNNEPQPEPLSSNKVENYLDEARATLRAPSAKEKLSNLQGGGQNNIDPKVQKKPLNH